MPARPTQPVLQSRPAALEQPYSPAHGGDQLLGVAEVCRRLDMSPSTFYVQLPLLLGRGLVEWQRPGGARRGKPRKFSAASLDALIRTGGRVSHALRMPVRVSQAKPIVVTRVDGVAR